MYRAVHVLCRGKGIFLINKLSQIKKWSCNVSMPPALRNSSESYVVCCAAMPAVDAYDPSIKHLLHTAAVVIAEPVLHLSNMLIAQAA